MSRCLVSLFPHTFPEDSDITGFILTALVLGGLGRAALGCLEPQTSTFYLFYFYREETICVNCLNHSKLHEYHLTGSVPCSPVIRTLPWLVGMLPPPGCLANTALPTLRHQVMLDGRMIGACCCTGPTLGSSGRARMDSLLTRGTHKDRRLHREIQA